MAIENIFLFSFAKPANFTFMAGQYIQLRMLDGEGKASVRSYSITSSPKESTLDFCAFFSPQGQSATYFSKLKIGSPVFFDGPYGNFVCSLNHAPCKVFIGFGTGLAPLVSMVKEQLLLNNAQHISLFAVIGKNETVLWESMLESLSAANPAFKYDIVFTDGEESADTTHLIEESSLKQLLEQSADFYLCGQLEKVKKIRLDLFQQGVLENKIHFEIF